VIVTHPIGGPQASLRHPNLRLSVDVKVSLFPDHQIQGPEGLVVPEWVIDLRNELLEAKGKTCPELADRMSLLVKQADHPFLCTMLIMQYGLPASETYLQDFILDDVVLKQLLIRHSFNDPRPVLSDASCRFLFKLSEGQGDEFNIDLHRHFSLSAEDLKIDPRRLFNSILICHLPTAHLTQAVQNLELSKKIIADEISESTLLLATLKLLSQHPACSYATHDHLLAMIEIKSSADNKQTQTLITNWRQAVHTNQPVVPAHRFLLLEIYRLVVEEDIFGFSCVSDREIELAIKALVRNEGLLTAGQLAKATHTAYGMQIFKELLTCPQQLNDYLIALENTEMLTTSLEQDLGL